MAKLMAPNIRIDWIPRNLVADPENITIAELNSGYNLSPAIVTGFTLDFTDSDTVDTANIYNTFASEAFTHHNYEANLQFFLAPRGSKNDSVNENAYREAERLFYKRNPYPGYLVKRVGYKWDVPYHVNQKIDIFYVQPTVPKVVSEEDSPILLEVPFLPMGYAASGTGVMIPNLIVNGDLENGTTGWSVQNGELSSTTTWNHQMWGGLGGHLAMLESNVSSYFHVTAYQEFLHYYKQGDWIGFSGYVACDTGQEFRIQIEFHGALETKYSSTDWQKAGFYEGVWVHEAFEIPHDCERIRINIQGNITPETSKRFWFDKVMAVWALTEGEALVQTEKFTPHKDD